MSLFDDLSAEVSEAKKHFKKQTDMINSLTEFMLDELPNSFGGVLQNYHFVHPTEPGAEAGQTHEICRKSLVLFSIAKQPVS